MSRTPFQFAPKYNQAQCLKSPFCMCRVLSLVTLEGTSIGLSIGGSLYVAGFQDSQLFSTVNSLAWPNSAILKSSKTLTEFKGSLLKGISSILMHCCLSFNSRLQNLAHYM